MPLRSPLHLGRLALWFFLTFVAAAIGSIAAFDAPAFYAALDKPSWAPPAVAFGPVWTVLYVTMAIAAWLVSREDAAPGRRRALQLYTVQLAVNTLWSWTFFRWRSGALSFLDIALLIVLVALTIAAFWPIRRLASVLLLPYLAWITFASAVNWSVWQRNPALLG